MLISESGFNDTTGAVLTLALVGALESGRFTLPGPALEFFKELAIGTFGQLSEIATLLVFVTLGMNLPFHALEK
jgi:NhaP-type Na+/H+ or K+/H+ antiporter